MLGLRFAVDELWPDDVANGVSYEDGGSHDRFLSGSSNITGTDGNDQTDHWSEEARKRIADDWNSGMISPLRLPNHDTTSNDRQTTDDEHGNACVGNNGWDVSAQGNKDDTNAAHGELEQNGVQGIVSKSGNNQRPKARDGSVDSVPD